MSYPNFSPYIKLSLKLVCKPRRGGGNMFRHQMDTFAILLEYGYTSPVLLKAALIHDIIEDSPLIGMKSFDEIIHFDEDGKEVLFLVQQVSQRLINGEKEPKSDFLLRIMCDGSENAKILKIADRISNISALPLAGDTGFINKYVGETEQYILPYAHAVNKQMALELENRLLLIKNKN